MTDWIPASFSWLPYGGLHDAMSPGDVILFAGEYAVVLAAIVWAAHRLIQLRRSDG